MRGVAWALWEHTPEQARSLVRPALAALRRRRRFHTPLPPDAEPPDLPPDAVELDTLIGTLWFDGADEHLTPWIERQAAWEADVMKLLARTLRPGSVFVDVGANVGFHTVLAAQLVGPTGKVFAIEPTPSTLQILRANLWRHGLNATVLPVAASERAGPMELAVDPTYRSGAHLAESGIEVRAAPLDELLPETVADLLKVDVEGAEPLVFRGARRLLERSPDLVAVVEFRLEPSPSGESPSEVLALYESVGFDLLFLRRSGDLEPATAEAVLERARRVASMNLVLRRR